MRLQCERAEGEGAEADSKSSLICVRAQNSARREHFPKKESPVRLSSQDDAISIFKIAELCYRGEIIVQEILMLVGQARTRAEQ